MKSLSYARKLQSIAGAAAICAIGLATPVAQAQNFETFYGERSTNDIGQDVKAVRFCDNGNGSILVGTRRNGNFTEALVTRVDNNGVPLWQNAYRVANNNSTIANAVVEVANGAGFAVTGAVAVNGTSIYVLRLRCDGSPLWATLLANQATTNRAVGYDIIEAQVAATAPAELVVVGEELFANAQQTTHGRIARLNAAGVVLWNRAYIRAGQLPGLRFRAATMAVPVGSPLLTDIVVAGSAAAGATWANDRRGLIYRVNGAGNPVCNNTVGRVDPVNEDFFGITTLRQPQFTGNNVLVGSTSGGTAAIVEQVFLTRYATGNCQLVVQSVWKDPQDSSVALDVVESLVQATGALTTIRATGSIRGNITAGDGFLLTANPANLGPALAQFRYSTQSPRHENLQAIDNKKDRFVMLGSTQTDWDGVGDPQDFYMVQTDPNGKTQCARDWVFDWGPTQQPEERFEQTLKEMQPNPQVDVVSIPAFDFGYCCALNPN